VRGARKPVAALLLGAAAATAVVWVAFPELVLRTLLAYSRRAARLELRTSEAEGAPIAYLEGGSGPCVVLLHGFGGSKETWLGVAGNLTAGYRVIVPDLPGFGGSPARVGEEHGPAQQAARLRKFLGEVGVESHHLAGLSMGGEIAAFYAAHYPDALRSLLLVAAPGVRAPVRTEFLRRVLAGENPLRVDDEGDLDALLAMASFRAPSLPGILKRGMVRDMAPRQEIQQRILADIVRAGEDALAPLLPRITAPTLVLWGAEDRLIHPSSAAVYEAAIPQAEAAVLPGCGHDLPGDCLDGLIARYLPFLAAHP
jgi:pimeloyl-ACP methyl ester carboxylesterase